MKFVIVLAALFAVALARPNKDATIVKYESDNIGIDGYNFAYETSDGTSHSESAKLKNVGSEDEAMVVHGSYSWVGADGHKYTLTYEADENGYRPQGAHLPVA